MIRKHARVLVFASALIASRLLAAEGQVFLRTDPAGAEAFLQIEQGDKQELKSLGKTPALLRLPEGRNFVTFKMPKYKEFQVEVDVLSQGIQKPEPYKLEVVSYPVDVIWLEEGWEISVDKVAQIKDEKPVTAPATLQLLDGKHDITLTKDGFEPLTKPILVKADKATLDFSQEKPKKAPKKAAVVQTGPMDLLKLADVKDGIGGQWELVSGVLTSGNAPYAKLPFKYTPPEEYQIETTVERVSGNDALTFGLVLEGRQFTAVIDAYEGTTAGLEMIAGKRATENATRFKGKQTISAKPAQVMINVRKTEISLSVNGRKLFNWKAEPEKLSLVVEWAVPQKDCLFVGGYQSTFKFTRFDVTPLH